MGYMITTGPARHSGCGKAQIFKIRAGGRHGAGGGATLTQRRADVRDVVGYTVGYSLQADR